MFCGQGEQWRGREWDRAGKCQLLVRLGAQCGSSGVREGEARAVVGARELWDEAMAMASRGQGEGKGAARGGAARGRR